MTYQDQLPGLFKQIPYVRNFRDLRLDFRDTIVSDFLFKYLLLFTKAVTIFKLLHLKVSNFVFEQEISYEKIKLIACLKRVQWRYQNRERRGRGGQLLFYVLKQVECR